MLQFNELLDRIKGAPVQTPNLVAIPDNHVFDKRSAPQPFTAGEAYFSIHVNSLQLEASRMWATTWDPMLMAVTEFNYNGEKITVPFVVGSELLKVNADIQLPSAMLFSETQVAGTHPYRGGSVSLAIILFRVKREDYLKRLLGVIQTTSSVIDQGTALTQFVKVGQAVVDGVEALLGDGNTVPVLGMRREFNPIQGAPFEPGYFALFSDNPISANSLWVYNSHLWVGSQSASAEPLTGRDQVVFSIARTVERSDAEDLPAFTSLVRTMLRAANVPTTSAWKVAKAHLATLYEELKYSPDITSAQADTLYSKYESMALDAKNAAERRAKLAVGESDSDPVLNRAASILVD